MSVELGAPCQSPLGSMIQSETQSALSCRKVVVGALGIGIVIVKFVRNWEGPGNLEQLRSALLGLPEQFPMGVGVSIAGAFPVEEPVITTGSIVHLFIEPTTIVGLIHAIIRSFENPPPLRFVALSYLLLGPFVPDPSMEAVIRASFPGLPRPDGLQIVGPGPPPSHGRIYDGLTPLVPLWESFYPTLP